MSKEHVPWYRRWFPFRILTQKSLEALEEGLRVEIDNKVSKFYDERHDDLRKERDAAVKYAADLQKQLNFAHRKEQEMGDVVRTLDSQGRVVSFEELDLLSRVCESREDLEDARFILRYAHEQRMPLDELNYIWFSRLEKIRADSGERAAVYIFRQASSACQRGDTIPSQVGDRLREAGKVLWQASRAGKTPVEQLEARISKSNFWDSWKSASKEYAAWASSHNAHLQTLGGEALYIVREARETCRGSLDVYIAQLEQAHGEFDSELSERRAVIAKQLRDYECRNGIVFAFTP